MAWIWTPWLIPSMSRAQSAAPEARIRVLSGGSWLLGVGRSFGLALRTHDLDLDPGKQRRHRAQRGQNRGNERERSTDHHTSCQRYFQQLLVVGVADDQAPDIALCYQLLGAVDEFAACHLDLLGPCVFALHTGVLYSSRLFAHGSSPFLSSRGFPFTVILVVLVLLSLLSPPVVEDRRCPGTSCCEDHCFRSLAQPGLGAASYAGFVRRAVRPLVVALAGLWAGLLSRARAVHRGQPRSAAAPRK